MAGSGIAVTGKSILCVLKEELPTDLQWWAKRKSGTKVTFKPDSTIFETLDFQFEVLSQRLRELHFSTGYQHNFEDKRQKSLKEVQNMTAVLNLLLNT